MLMKVIHNLASLITNNDLFITKFKHSYLPLCAKLFSTLESICNLKESCIGEDQKREHEYISETPNLLFALGGTGLVALSLCYSLRKYYSQKDRIPATESEIADYNKSLKSPQLNN